MSSPYKVFLAKEMTFLILFIIPGSVLQPAVLLRISHEALVFQSFR